MTGWFKLLSLFLFCAFFFKAGMPAAAIFFQFNFIKTFIFSVGSAFLSNILFTYFSYYLINKWKSLKKKWNFSHKRAIFTKKNRRIIRVKKSFGLIGIAILSPILISIPVGAFLGERFYKNKQKVILYLTAAEIFWFFILFFGMEFFYYQLKGILF